MKLTIGKQIGMLTGVLCGMIFIISLLSVVGGLLVKNLNTAFIRDSVTRVSDAGWINSDETDIQRCLGELFLATTSEEQAA